MFFSQISPSPIYRRRITCNGCPVWYRWKNDPKCKMIEQNLFCAITDGSYQLHEIVFCQRYFKLFNSTHAFESECLGETLPSSAGAVVALVSFFFLGGGRRVREKFRGWGSKKACEAHTNLPFLSINPQIWLISLLWDYFGGKLPSLWCCHWTGGSWILTDWSTPVSWNCAVGGFLVLSVSRGES